ncbi:hypothetical protein [Rhodoferax sp. WC2427]|uniref:hypothetical protein n=1 Tax=Rhodoferax sp. WC2427 TaxID=3234144 RepID=UPI003466B16D
MPALNLNLDALQAARAELVRQRDAQRSATLAWQQAQAALDTLARTGASADALQAQAQQVADLRRTAQAALQGTAQRLQGIQNLSQDLLAHLQLPQDNPAPLVEALDAAHPVALLPVAVQTRYTADASELMVRIYPDAIHSFGHEPGLSEAETAEGKRYWAERFATPSDTESPWLQIARIYTPARAAWIVRSTTPTNFDQLGRRIDDADAVLVSPEFDDAAIPQASRVGATVYATALPDRFVVVGQSRGREVFRVWGQPVADLLPMNPAFDPLTATDEAEAEKDPFGGDRAWLVDFPAAVKAGMAIRVTANDMRNGATLSDPIDRLVVLGVDWTQTPDSAATLLASLLDNHQHSAGLKLVAQGTPTNNTSTTRAAFAANGADLLADMDPQTTSQRSADGAFELATAGGRLQGLLGLPVEVFDAGTVPGATLRESASAGHMVNALWSATLGYTLRYFWNPRDTAQALISDAAVEQLRAWSVRYLRPGGPLSTLRVGQQPYGILPICARDFVPSPRSALERELTEALDWLRPHWDSVVYKVPTLRNPSAESLHQVLSMQPWACAKRYNEVIGPATTQNNPAFAELVQFQGAFLRGLMGQLLSRKSAAVQVPYLSLCAMRPKQNSLDAVPWVQRDPDNMPREREGAALLQPNYIATLHNHLGDPVSDLRARIVPMQNGNSLLEAMLAFAADEEILKSGHALFYAHVQNSASVSPLVKSQFQRMGLAEYVGVATSTLVGDQVEVNTARSMMGVRLEGTTANRSVEGHIAQYLGQSATLWPEQMQNIASFKDSLAFLQDCNAGELQQAFRTTLDLYAHRLDAWITALATHRLDTLRAARPQGLHLGAFGVVEDLLPDVVRRRQLPPGQSQALDSLGYIHAPSVQQATAAAVLRSGFLANGQAPGQAFDIDLRSQRVQRAKQLLEGIANGQSMAALLGYRFERGMTHSAGQALAQYILECRQAYPLRPAGASPQDEASESIAARDVVDGVRLMDAYRTARAAGTAFKVPGVPDALLLPHAEIAVLIDDLLEQMDAVSDLLVSESVYQMVSGNLDGAGAAMMTLDKQTRPPEPRVADTPHSTRGYTQRLVVALESADPGPWAVEGELTARMEPRLNAWLARLLGDPGRYQFQAQVFSPPTGDNGDWVVTDTVLTAGIAELGLSPLALVLHSEAQQGAGQSGVQERLGQLMGNKLRAQLGAAADGLAVVLQADAPEAGQIGLVAFESLAWVLRRLLAKTRPLRRMDMVQARDGVESAATQDDGEAAGVDLAELEVRCQDAERQADAVLALLADASAAAPEDLDTLDPLDPATPALLAQTHTALAAAYALGWRSAAGHTPVAAGDGQGQPLSDDDTAARAVGRARALLLEIGGRTTAARTAPVSDGRGGQLQALLDRIHAVMGKDFPVLPLFTLGAFAADAAASLGDRDMLLGKAALGNDDAAIAGWLPKLACVREASALLADTLLAAEALGEDSGYLDDPLDFQLLQFPRNPLNHWAALPPAPKQKLQDLRGVVAIAAHAPGGLRALDAASTLSGLFVDEWMETIPSDTETTGVGFHFDAPGARPPQSILLAVPADPAADHWTLESLLDTVNEAMALAQLRAVRPQDLEGLGLLLPGIFLSNNFKQDVPSIDFASMVSKNLYALRAASGVANGKATMAAGTAQFATKS